MYRDKTDNTGRAKLKEGIKVWGEEKLNRDQTDSSFPYWKSVLNTLTENELMSKSPLPSVGKTHWRDRNKKQHFRTCTGLIFLIGNFGCCIEVDTQPTAI